MLLHLSSPHASFSLHHSSRFVPVCEYVLVSFFTFSLELLLLLLRLLLQLLVHIFSSLFFCSMQSLSLASFALIFNFTSHILNTIYMVHCRWARASEASELGKSSKTQQHRVSIVHSAVVVVAVVVDVVAVRCWSATISLNKNCYAVLVSTPCNVQRWPVCVTSFVDCKICQYRNYISTTNKCGIRRNEPTTRI